jgi:hypothetical protein
MPNDMAQRRVERMFENLWDINEKKEEASKDLENTRRQIVVDSEKANKNKSEVGSKKLDALFDRFESDNKDVISIYKSKPEVFEYDQVAESAKTRYKKILEDFYNTGEVSDELGAVLLHGTLAPLHLNEKKTMIGSIKALNESLTKKEQEVKELKEKLGIFKPKTKQTPRTTSGKEEEEVAPTLGAHFKDFLQNADNFE